MHTPTEHNPSVVTDPSASSPSYAEGEPLTDEHYQALRDAKVRRKKIDRAVSVASFNGWSTGVFAALSAPFALFSFSGFLVCLGLGVVAYHEFKGRAMLLAFDLRGPRVLGYNQIGFGALLVAYCLWSLYEALAGPNPYAQYIEADPAMANMLGGIGDLYTFGAVIVYGSVIVLTVPYQAFMAWYYFSRSKHLRDYLSQTPGWIAQAQRAVA